MNEAKNQPLPKVEHLVEMERQKVDKKIDLINERLCGLRDKLHPVLNPSYGDEQVPVNVPTSNQQYSPLVNDFLRLGDRLDGVIDSIVKIFEHLEV